MTQKLSPHKVSKMMALFFDGYSQTDIANKLKIDQSTVSLYVGKFKSISEQQGIKAAGEEFRIMDQIEALHSLASELKKDKLTVEEAAVGHKMVQSLSKLGISQKEYKGVLQACTKLKSEGFLNSAVKLNKLEHDTGMTYEDIVAKATYTYQELKQTQQDLLGVASKLKAALALEEAKKQTGLTPEALEKKVEELQAAASELEPLASKAKETEKQVDELEAKKHELSDTVSTLSQQRDSLKKEIALKVQHINDLAAQAAELEEKAHAANVELAGARGDLKILDQIGLSADALAVLTHEIKSIASHHGIGPASLSKRLFEELTKLDKAMGLESVIKTREDALSKVNKAIADARKEKAAIKAANNKLSEEQSGLAAVVEEFKKHITDDLEAIDSGQRKH